MKYETKLNGNISKVPPKAASNGTALETPKLDKVNIYTKTQVTDMTSVITDAIRSIFIFIPYSPVLLMKFTQAVIWWLAMSSSSTVWSTLLLAIPLNSYLLHLIYRYVLILQIPQEKTSKTEDVEEQLDFEAEEGECVEAPEPKLNNVDKNSEVNKG